MKILISAQDKHLLKRIDQVPHNGTMRYYYVADKAALFHLVSRVGPVRLLDTPCVVDASLGWGEGWHGKCHPHHEGLKLTKITLRRLSEDRYDKRLSRIIRESRRLPEEPYRTKRWGGE